MHLRTILAIARKDTLDILLNKATLSILITPIFLAILFVVIQVLIGNTTTNVLIYDPGRSGIEQLVKQSLDNVKFTYVNAPQDVQVAFGPDKAHKNTSYALGLVISDGFEQNLADGQHPQLEVYINGNQINAQQSALLQSAITNYTRQVANPQPPAMIAVATINPPAPSSNSGLQDIGQMYSVAVLLCSFIVGSALVPGLLTEEKEKKTLRMLMVTPASFTDVVAGKLLVGLVYQLILSSIVLAIKGSFTGQIPLTLLFMLLGAMFSISVGLLAGSIFQTTSAAGAFAGIASFIYIIPVFFVGTFGQLFGNNPFSVLIKVLPTYYIADGVANALSGQASWSSTLLDVGIVLACIMLIFLLAVSLLRRQAAIASTI